MVFSIFFLPISAMQLSQEVCHFYFSPYFGNGIATNFLDHKEFHIDTGKHPDALVFTLLI